MSTPIEPLQQDAFSPFVVGPSSDPAIDPDNPPWGVAAAVFAWIVSVLLLGLIPFFAVSLYLSYRQLPLTQENFNRALSVDPQGILTSILAVIPSHLFTLAIVWALVTGFGKRPFWQTIGWSWGVDFGLWKSVSVAVILLLFIPVLVYFFGDEKTPFEQMMESSDAARFATAFLAIATAPLIEELIYRGLLYPAFRKVVGMIPSVAIVSFLFAGVHVWQYKNNLAVITTITILAFILTYIRARTGRLLPCFVIHLVFNGLQVVLLIYQYINPVKVNESEGALILDLALQTARLQL